MVLWHHPATQAEGAEHKVSGGSENKEVGGGREAEPPGMAKTGARPPLWANQLKQQAANEKGKDGKDQ